MNIGTLQAYLGLETAEFDAKMAKSVKSIEKAGKKMRDIGMKMSLMITLPLTLAGGAAVKLASDLEENINKTKESFKQAADGVLQWSNTTVTSIGLAKSTALEMVSLFGDMATSMGYSEKGAAEMSMSLVTLAADLASFKNLSIEQAQTALAGIFTGETESLKRLGIVMTQSALESFTAAKGMKEYSDKMTQAEKVAVRYAYVMDVTKNSQGDFARTAGGTANQMRIFQESVKELGANFGKLLLPVVTPIIKGFSQLMQRMSTLTDVQKKWIIGIAAVAAAIGPLLYGLGMIVKVAPSVVKGILTIQGALARLMTVIIANPYLALAAAIVAIGAGLYIWWKRGEGVSKVQKAIKEGIDNANVSIKLQQVEMNGLFDALKKANKGSAEKTNLLKTINERYGEYLPNLLTEKSTLEDIEKAQKSANDELTRTILLKSRDATLSDLLEDVYDRQVRDVNKMSAKLTKYYTDAEISKGMKDFVQRMKAGELAQQAFRNSFKGTETEKAWQGISVFARNMKSWLDEENTIIKEVQTSYNSLLSDLQTPIVTPPITDPETPPGGGAATLTEQMAELQNQIKKVNADYEVTKDLLTDENALQQAKIKHLTDVFELNKQIYLLNPTEAGLQALKDEWAVLEKTVTTTENKLALAEHLDFINEKAIERSKAIKEAEQAINEEYKLSLYLAKDKKAQLQAEYDRLSSIYQLKKQLAAEDKVFSAEELAALKLIYDQLTAQKLILDTMKDNSTPQTWAEKWSSAAEQVESAINQAMETVIDGLINAMSSVEKVNIGQFLMNTLAELAIRVGKIAVMTAIAVEGIKEALKSLNPYAALVAGIALIALGTAVKASLENSVQGLATGGRVTKSGAFMVGEEGPELVKLNAGSAVVPNHELGGDVNKTLELISMVSVIENKIDNLKIMTSEIFELIQDMMFIMLDMSDRLKRLMWTSILGPAGVLFAGMESGGQVTKSGAFMVGEAGHEIVIPSRNGMNFSKNLLGNTGGGEPYILSTRISGRDLEVIMQRAKAQNKRR